MTLISQLTHYKTMPREFPASGFLFSQWGFPCIECVLFYPDVNESLQRLSEGQHLKNTNKWPHE